MNIVPEDEKEHATSGVSIHTTLIGSILDCMYVLCGSQVPYRVKRDKTIYVQRSSENSKWKLFSFARPHCCLFQLCSDWVKNTCSPFFIRMNNNSVRSNVCLCVLYSASCIRRWAPNTECIRLWALCRWDGHKRTANAFIIVSMQYLPVVVL